MNRIAWNKVYVSQDSIEILKIWIGFIRRSSSGYVEIQSIFVLFYSDSRPFKYTCIHIRRTRNSVLFHDFTVNCANFVIPYTWYDTSTCPSAPTYDLELHSGCEIEYFVETHICKLCDTPILRIAGCGSSLKIFCLFVCTLVPSSFWTSRDHRYRPFSPPVLAFNFYRA